MKYKAFGLFANVLLVVAACLGFGAGAAMAQAPQFGDYPAQLYSGPVRAPDLSSHPDAATYRTRLRDAARGQVNFAGEFILTSWGCGANCLMGAALNARTGRVTFLPGTVCCWDVDRQNPIDYRDDSNLIVLTGLINEQDPAGTHYYELRRGEFRLVRRQSAAAGGRTSTAVRTQSNARRMASSGADVEVTDFTLTNDTPSEITVNWLNGQANEIRSEGGDQTKTHRWLSSGQQWRVERGAKTWQSHWFAIVSRQGFVCSFSPRQGETVRLSQLPVCAAIADAPQSVAPSCPSGYVFDRGQCVRDATPAPSCPSGFEFRQGQCVRATTARPPAADPVQQCVAGCDGVERQCKRRLAQLGDAQSWDGDLRQDYWDNTCVPKVNACKFACNPQRPIGPGECRYTADGGKVCS